MPAKAGEGHVKDVDVSQPRREGSYLDVACGRTRLGKRAFPEGIEVVGFRDNGSEAAELVERKIYVSHATIVAPLPAQVTHQTEHLEVDPGRDAADLKRRPLRNEVGLDDGREGGAGHEYRDELAVA